MTCSHPPVREELTLPADERAPAAARRFVAEAGAGCDPDVIADAQLLVSELVSNVVRHTRRTEVVVATVTTAEGALRVEVSHRGRGFFLPLRHRGPLSERASGWGLEIVDRLASGWGVCRAPRATVWFEVAPQ